MTETNEHEQADEPIETSGRDDYERCQGCGALVSTRGSANPHTLCSTAAVLYRIAALRAVQETELALHKRAYAMLQDAALDLTRQLDEHPEGYDGPCECAECIRIAAEGA